jgi:hypothetical protein
VVTVVYVTEVKFHNGAVRLLLLRRFSLARSSTTRWLFLRRSSSIPPPPPHDPISSQGEWILRSNSRSQANFFKTKVKYNIPDISIHVGLGMCSVPLGALSCCYRATCHSQR